MEMRVTLQSSVNQALFNLRNVTDQLAVTTQQASSGKRILQPSDDPVGAVSAMQYHAQDQRLDTYLSNITDAQSTLNTSVSTLLDMGTLFSQAKQLAIEGTNSGNDQNALNALSQEVDAVLNRVVNDANTKNGEQYLFSGTATQTQPFTLGPSGSYTYQGASDRASTIINQGQTVDTLYSGREIFQSQQRGPTVYGGTTGAAVGTGTDSATGQGTLLIQHTSTAYTGASGVKAGSGSAAGDTIIGPAGTHTLTIVDTSGLGTSGTVSLDNGPPIAFTSSDTNLKVAGPGNAVVYLDTSAIAPGFNGSVAITANGTLSVDNGATKVPINFSSNQVVTNGTTGAITNVNSTNIQSTGTASLDYTGTYDAFQVLQALRDDLRNTRGLSEADQMQSISQRLAELDRVRTNILQVVGAQSADLQNLQGLQSHLDSMQLQTRQLTSNTEDADISQVVVNLQSQQNLLQLTLAATSKIFQQNLADFLK
ncbi:MAG TPA: flagellar hook-associated protein FlgL [Gemmataceae bacterium]|nr:flagellar hook-associated protein FlgL [Gemmataceae bacterium]